MSDITCSVSLENLTKDKDLCANNMSGVKAIYVAFKNDIATFPSLPSTRTTLENLVQLVGDITMKAGKRFFAIETKKNSAELIWKTQGESGNRSFNGNLELIHPSIKSKVLGFLAATSNQELVVLAKLKNGEVHMLGDEDNGAELVDENTATSGKAPTDANGATINISYDAPAPQLYIGDIEGLLSEDSGSGQ